MLGFAFPAITYLTYHVYYIPFSVAVHRLSPSVISSLPYVFDQGALLEGMEAIAAEARLPVSRWEVKQILNKPEVSRKLAKYTVELDAYNITYVPRNAIKGQRTPYDGSYTLSKRSLKGVVGRARPIPIRYRSTLMLSACQMNDEFVANSEGMEKYLAKAKEHATLFKIFLIENIPQNWNQKADVLSKLASVAFNHLTKEVLVEVLNTKSMDSQEVSTIVEEEEDNWMTPIIKCLEEGVWPTNENDT
ncbi:hypothetical protein Tco_0400565 [Tanacetum coccineum]